MINEKVSNEELEAFIAEPVNGMVMMPNRDLAVAMAKELLDFRRRKAARTVPEIAQDMAHVTSDLIMGWRNTWKNQEDLRASIQSCIEGAICQVLDQLYPEKLPCPVLLEPGWRFGKGVSTSIVLKALQRRADYCAELEAMTPEERAEHDANIEDFKAMLPPQPTAPEDPE